MIKEAHCSREVAELLKEKGFNEPVHHEYHYINSTPHFHKKSHNFNGEGYANCGTEWFSAPTHQMAMAWLRKEHYIYADPIKQGNYNDCSEYYTWIVARMGIIHRNSSVADKLSYEEAVEAALRYSLENLI